MISLSHPRGVSHIRAGIRRSVVGLFALLCVNSLQAQPVGKLPAGTTFSRMEGVAIYQFAADLDEGGDLGLTSAGLKFDLLRSLGEGRSVGGSLGYTTDLYDFGGAVGLGNMDPWDTVNTLTLAGFYGSPLGDDWQLMIAPSITASRESSASFSDSLTFGAVFSFTREVSQTLTIGLGAGLFTGLEQTRGFPFLAIRWEFAPGWTLQNPFRPGPAGPAGLEVAYKTDTWEFGLGGAYRSFRFRLADDGPVPNGIGEHNSVPFFIRATRPLSTNLTLDLYGGFLFGGSIELENSTGGRLARSDFDPAPIVALSLSGRF